jgi:hypothetical protein
MIQNLVANGSTTSDGRHRRRIQLLDESDDSSWSTLASARTCNQPQHHSIQFSLQT